MPSSDDDIMLTDQELRRRTRKRRRLIVIAVVLVLASVAAFFGARPASNATKAWQARRHAQRAFAAIDSERWDEARNEAVAAYRLRQTEPQAVRAVARFLSRTRQPDALEVWTQLAKIDKLTRDDLRDEATIALMANEIARAEPAVRELLARKDAGPPEWLLAAQLSINKGAPGDAQTFLDRVLIDSRATPREQLQASVLQLTSARSGSSTPNERETAAWSRLEKLSADKGAVGLDALVVLSQRALSSSVSSVNPVEAAVPAAGSKPIAGGTPATTATTQVDLANALEKHPLAKAQHKLLALDLRMHADESQRDALVVRAINHWKNADAGGLSALATWVNGN